MIFSVANNLLSDNVSLLKSRVTKTTYQGVLIALISIVVATILVSFYLTGEISLDGIVKAQTSNFALWVLDCIPFVFGFWGQYSSTIIAYEASTIIFDQTQELRNQAEDLQKQANFAETRDTVTGFPNRALFYDRVEQTIAVANKQKRILSILLIEIENHKEIYDTLGQNSTDLIVSQVATRLEGLIIDLDSVARIDTTVFGILLTDIVEETEALLLVQNIQKAMEPIFLVERMQLAVNTNIGIVFFPSHGEDVDTLVQRAGVALYIARNSNEGYAVYEFSFDEHNPRRLTLMSELRLALAREQLELFYQAKVSLGTSGLYGAEALVRWHHPRHGFIPPDEFIPMAERTRMIKPLTHWVLKHAFQQCADWHEQGIELQVSVNLSAKDLHDPELPDVIAAVAAVTSVSPEWIILEITESSIMTDPERAMIIIERLHKMGYKLSIDDYGTGYSSLAYLKKMPLTELKIDRSFVADILKNENDAVIVHATINLAHNLGLQVTAEGVESKEIMAKLTEFECDIVQGYYINKPLSVSDFNQWMETSQWKVG
jgi:diguanylate cyclase (GGDEF)-like protein